MSYFIFFCNSRMFYSDWGGTPKINTAYMDGTEITAIVDTNLVYPQSLTADLDLQRIYCVDTNLDVVESVKYDGSGRTKIFSGHQVSGCMYFIVDKK